MQYELVWVSTTGRTSGSTSGNLKLSMDAVWVSMSQYFQLKLSGTTRKTSPNCLLRAQNLKIIFSLSEVDTKEGQAHVQSRCTLSWRSWLHPWDRCHTATLSGHWFCFSVCTIFGHCTYGKTVKYTFVSISILFPTSGQMLTVDFVPGIFVFLSQYEWRSTGLF